MVSTNAPHVIVEAVGLTKVEAEYIFANMLYADRRLTDEAPSRVIREKRQIIRKSGTLEFIPLEELRDLRVGGLEWMLEWLELRRRVFEDADRAKKEYGIDRIPRGVLLVGISGCGKSLTCKTIAKSWGCPLLRMDMSAVFDRWVGSSEERMRRALKVAESIAPCILWVDEIEKGFSVGSGGDGGTSMRVLGTFLVWLQEKKAPVFVAATANDISALPPEFSRAERFDAVYFLDLPSEAERQAIWRIYLSKFAIPDQPLPDDANWTGAEIRSCCRLASLLDVSLLDAARNVVPVAATAAESIERLRTWACGRCLSANAPGLYSRPRSGRDQVKRRVSRSVSAT